MKKIVFLGHSLKELKTFPQIAKREVGFQLDNIQRGIEPNDWKPMKGIGAGVREIRVQHESEYRVIYVAKFEESIYVLHAFQKKTQKTSKHDLEIAKRAYKSILESRQ